eukprot:GILJ01014851.1.p1 GENE.GILJ01014851.1~~GILJ01014851.1.p1  ORF type:complete len:822 (-),score=152.92 GILJ01014851.1:143-2488(-)
MTQTQPTTTGIQQQRPLASAEQCEGCFQNPAVAYCADCERLLCTSCDDRSHSIPANQHHQRVSTSDAIYRRKLCTVHGHSLKFYCDTCEQPCCIDCRTKGPHHTQLHRVADIMSAFRSRLGQLQNLINSSLVHKKESIHNELQQIEIRMDEIRNARQRIERDTKVEYNRIVERLRGAEGIKMAVLQHDVAELQREIDRIQHVSKEVAEVYQFNMNRQPAPVPAVSNATVPQPVLGSNVYGSQLPGPLPGRVPGGQVGYGYGSPYMNPISDSLFGSSVSVPYAPDIFSFLQRYPSILSIIDELVNNPTRQLNQDVVPDDLPKEVKEREEMIERYKSVHNLLRVKDQIIWSVLKDRQNIIEQQNTELKEEAQNEIQEWAKLADRFSDELKRFQLTCYYCGVAMDDVSVNTDCPLNTNFPPKIHRKSYNTPDIMNARNDRISGSVSNWHAGSSFAATFVGFTESMPPAALHGTGRHFYAKKRMDGVLPTPLTNSDYAFYATKDNIIHNNNVAANEDRDIRDRDRIRDWDRDYAAAKEERAFPETSNRYGQAVRTSYNNGSNMNKDVSRREFEEMEREREYQRQREKEREREKEKDRFQRDKARAQDQVAQTILRKLGEAVQSRGIALESAFRSFDLDGDGFISAYELSSVLNQLRVGLTREEIDRLIDLFDTDHDNRISFREFLDKLHIYTPPTRLKSNYDYEADLLIRRVAGIIREKGIKLEDAFRVFDQNQDGYISREEFRRTFEQMQLGLTNDDMNRLLNAVDENRDGTISYVEFLKKFTI